MMHIKVFAASRSRVVVNRDIECLLPRIRASGLGIYRLPLGVDSSRPDLRKAAVQPPSRLACTPMTAFSDVCLSSRRQRTTGDRSGPVIRSENGDRQERGDCAVCMSVIWPAGGGVSWDAPASVLRHDLRAPATPYVGPRADQPMVPSALPQLIIASTRPRHFDA